MNLRRRDALSLMGGALLLPSCARSSNIIRVGSKNFSENITVAEIIAQTLEKAGFKIERHMNLGSTQIAMAAMLRGDIDMYPEYTGTGLIDVLHMPPLHSAAAIIKTLRTEYSKRFKLFWLHPAPGNDSQGLVVPGAIAAKYGLRTLSDCASQAAQLRLAAIPEFLTRSDALPGLQKFYGGFHFKTVRTYDIGLQYQALRRGNADVATAFTTDAFIEADNLTVLRDDRNFWPPYNITPVVRLDTLRKYKRLTADLKGPFDQLTDVALRHLNVEVDIRKMDPSDAASEFIYG